MVGEMTPKSQNEPFRNVPGLGGGLGEGPENAVS